MKNSGAEAILLCANTMHLIYDELQHRVDLPILHIADATFIHARYAVDFAFS